MNQGDRREGVAKMSSTTKVNQLTSTEGMSAKKKLEIGAIKKTPTRARAHEAIFDRTTASMAVV